MYIDPKSLPPKYQAQVMKKLAEQNRPKPEQEQQEKKRAGKYHSIPDARETRDGGKLRFDSKKEARRFDELKLLLEAGKIRDLKLQPQFTLREAYTTPEGVHVRAIRYYADFSYEERREHPALGGEFWASVVEDVKSRATKTRVYALKKKLLLERFGIEIQEVE